MSAVSLQLQPGRVLGPALEMFRVKLLSSLVRPALLIREGHPHIQLTFHVCTENITFSRSQVNGGISFQPGADRVLGYF